MKALLTVLLGALLLASALAAAEQPYRYTVRGYVLDAQERPMSGWTLTVGRGGETLATATTDHEGHYSVTVPLRDRDIGGRLQLRVGTERASIAIRLERDDTRTEHEHWASFVGDRFSEQDVRGLRVPGWGWALAAVAGIAALLFTIARLERLVKKRRAAAARAAAPGRRHRHGRGRRR